jgi:hypothetical protein
LLVGVDGLGVLLGVGVSNAQDEPCLVAIGLRFLSSAKCGLTLLASLCGSLVQ